MTPKEAIWPADPHTKAKHELLPPSEDDNCRVLAVLAYLDA